MFKIISKMFYFIYLLIFYTDLHLGHMGQKVATSLVFINLVCN